MITRHRSSPVGDVANEVRRRQLPARPSTRPLSVTVTPSLLLAHTQGGRIEGSLSGLRLQPARRQTAPSSYLSSLLLPEPITNSYSAGRTINPGFGCRWASFRSPLSVSVSVSVSVCFCFCFCFCPLLCKNMLCCAVLCCVGWWCGIARRDVNSATVRPNTNVVL